MKSETKYLVLKLLTKVSYEHPISGKEHEQAIEGCDGFLPVYNNIEDAKEASIGGKYDIVEIQPKR